MKDPRIEKLSQLLVQYSMSIQPGEKVLIDYTGPGAKALVCPLIEDIYRAGGKPYVTHRDDNITRALLMQADEEQLQYQADQDLAFMKGMDAYVAIRGTENIYAQADVPLEKLALYEKITEPVLNQRVDHTKWVVMRWPDPSMAQLAGMSVEAFEDFYFQVCTLDYEKMDEAMKPLQALMEKTDQVHIKGPGTDLTFSIKGIPAVRCSGTCNIPDGEVYTAPVKESMNGYISYNTPSHEQGFTFEEIRFEIKDGKIIKATANDDERINQLLDTDEGARYFGEFAIGVNPYVLEPMKDTLFDEKICGSFHLTPGMCYEDAPNGNKSAVHWDLVNIQRPEYGGGEIYFDDVLIRKDGLFVLPELLGLNPENLK